LSPEKLVASGIRIFENERAGDLTVKICLDISLAMLWLNIARL
jgi:hypothetical protein